MGKTEGRHGMIAEKRGANSLRLELHTIRPMDLGGKEVNERSRRNVKLKMQKRMGWDELEAEKPAATKGRGVAIDDEKRRRDGDWVAMAERPEDGETEKGRRDNDME